MQVTELENFKKRLVSMWSPRCILKACQDPSLNFSKDDSLEQTCNLYFDFLTPTS